MTLKVDGTNGVLQAYDQQVLTTTFTYTFAAGTQLLIATPAGTLASGTITMPATAAPTGTPADGMTITFTSTQQITSLVIAANTGQSIVGGGTVLFPANGTRVYTYKSSTSTWYLTSVDTVGTSSFVTSAVAGNGIAVSAATGAVTFSAAAPTYNSVGSYAMVCSTSTSASSFVAGSNYSAGTGSGLIASAYLAYGGCPLSLGVSSGSVSGTWKWMSTTSGAGSYVPTGIAVRVA